MVILFPFVIILSFKPTFSEFKDMFLISLPFMAVLILNFPRYWFSHCRTIIMDKDGLTLKVFGIKKRYLWEEFATKSVEHYEMRLCGSNPGYYKAVIFSKRKNFHTPEDFHLNAYIAFCLNPFKFLFVGFMLDPNPKNNEVDEELFMEKMNEWGIELQRYKNGKFTPYKNLAGISRENEENK